MKNKITQEDIFKILTGKKTVKTNAINEDEDFIGRMKKCARSCTHGTQMHNVPNKLMENYAIILAVVFGPYRRRG